MSHYVLSTYQPDGPPPPTIDLADITERLTELNRDMQAAGVRVLAAHLSPAEDAFVVRFDTDEPSVSHGPYLKTQEHAGGLTVIDVPQPAAALQWAEKLAAATGLPVEVRALSENRDGLA